MPDTWGIVPAAGRGSRIQPLGFSKELLPVGSRSDRSGERPCAVSEHLVDRMVLGGAGKICFVIAPGKSDILGYFGADIAGVPTAYVVQPAPRGLCDAMFRADTVIGPDDRVLVGLPDTVWFPEMALAELPNAGLSFLLFPVEQPELFDSVVLDEDGRVLRIDVKRLDAGTNWIWGAFKMPARVFRDLRALWLKRERCDEYIGTLVNAYLAAGGQAVGIRAGASYFDVGTLDGYRAAMQQLSQVRRTPHPAVAVAPSRRDRNPNGSARGA